MKRALNSRLHASGQNKQDRSGVEALENPQSVGKSSPATKRRAQSTPPSTSSSPEPHVQPRVIRPDRAALDSIYTISSTASSPSSQEATKVGPGVLTEGTDQLSGILPDASQNGNLTPQQGRTTPMQGILRPSRLSSVRILEAAAARDRDRSLLRPGLAHSSGSSIDLTNQSPIHAIRIPNIDKDTGALTSGDDTMASMILPSTSFLPQAEDMLPTLQESCASLARNTKKVPRFQVTPPARVFELANIWADIRSDLSRRKLRMDPENLSILEAVFHFNQELGEIDMETSKTEYQDLYAGAATFTEGKESAPCHCDKLYWLMDCTEEEIRLANDTAAHMSFEQWIPVTPLHLRRVAMLWENYNSVAYLWAACAYLFSQCDHTQQSNHDATRSWLLNTIQKLRPEIATARKVSAYFPETMELHDQIRLERGFIIEKFVDVTTAILYSWVKDFNASVAESYEATCKLLKFANDLWTAGGYPQNYHPLLADVLCAIGKNRSMEEKIDVLEATLSKSHTKPKRNHLIQQGCTCSSWAAQITATVGPLDLRIEYLWEWLKPYTLLRSSNRDPGFLSCYNLGIWLDLLAVRRAACSSIWFLMSCCPAATEQHQIMGISKQIVHNTLTRGSRRISEFSNLFTELGTKKFIHPTFDISTALVPISNTDARAWIRRHKHSQTHVQFDLNHYQFESKTTSIQTQILGVSEAPSTYGSTAPTSRRSMPPSVYPSNGTLSIQDSTHGQLPPKERWESFEDDQGSYGWDHGDSVVTVDERAEENKENVSPSPEEYRRRSPLFPPGWMREESERILQRASARTLSPLQFQRHGEQRSARTEQLYNADSSNDRDAQPQRRARPSCMGVDTAQPFSSTQHRQPFSSQARAAPMGFHTTGTNSLAIGTRDANLPFVPPRRATRFPDTDSELPLRFTSTPRRPNDQQVANPPQAPRKRQRTSAYRDHTSSRPSAARDLFGQEERDGHARRERSSFSHKAGKYRARGRGDSPSSPSSDSSSDSEEETAYNYRRLRRRHSSGSSSSSSENRAHDTPGRRRDDVLNKLLKRAKVRNRDWHICEKESRPEKEKPLTWPEVRVATERQLALAPLCITAADSANHSEDILLANKLYHQMLNQRDLTQTEYLRYIKDKIDDFAARVRSWQTRRNRGQDDGPSAEFKYAAKMLALCKRYEQYLEDAKNPLPHLFKKILSDGLRTAKPKQFKDLIMKAEKLSDVHLVWNACQKLQRKYDWDPSAFYLVVERHIPAGFKEAFRHTVNTVSVDIVHEKMDALCAAQTQEENTRALKELRREPCDSLYAVMMKAQSFIRNVQLYWPIPQQQRKAAAWLKESLINFTASACRNTLRQQFDRLDTQGIDPNIDDMIYYAEGLERECKYSHQESTPNNASHILVRALKEEEKTPPFYDKKRMQAMGRNPRSPSFSFNRERSSSRQSGSSSSSSFRRPSRPSGQFSQRESRPRQRFQKRPPDANDSPQPSTEISKYITDHPIGPDDHQQGWRPAWTNGARVRDSLHSASSPRSYYPIWRSHSGNRMQKRTNFRNTLTGAFRDAFGRVHSPRQLLELLYACMSEWHEAEANHGNYPSKLRDGSQDPHARARVFSGPNARSLGINRGNSPAGAPRGDLYPRQPSPGYNTQYHPYGYSQSRNSSRGRDWIPKEEYYKLLEEGRRALSGRSTSTSRPNAEASHPPSPAAASTADSLQYEKDKEIKYLRRQLERALGGRERSGSKRRAEDPAEHSSSDRFRREFSPGKRPRRDNDSKEHDKKDPRSSASRDSSLLRKVLSAHRQGVPMEVKVADLFPSTFSPPDQSSSLYDSTSREEQQDREN